MIDNIEQIKPLMNFTDEGDFYMLYVFKRKKDYENGVSPNGLDKFMFWSCSRWSIKWILTLRGF